jgi:hypothetical protein
MPDVSLRAQLACARRELALRERVYPRWVAEERLLPSTAAHETAPMAAIVRTLQGLVEGTAAGVDGLVDMPRGTRWTTRRRAQGEETR